jgi:hypothetical protein
MSVIVALNQTAGDLALTQLPVPDNEIPASGSVTLTDYATVDEIQSDAELIAHITAGDVLLEVDGVTLTQAESLAAANPVIQMTPVFVDYYDATTSSVGTSATTLDLDTSRQSNAAFVLAVNQVTVQSGGDGDYLVSYSVTGGESDNNNRAVETWLEIDHVEVPASRGEFLHWDEHGLVGDGTAGRAMILTLTAGQVLRLRAQVTTGSAGYDTATGGVSLQISSIGSTGPPGVQGPVGSGSTISVEQGGVSAGSPFDALNFTGAGVTATDGGAGVATITIPGGSSGANIAQYRRAANQTINTSATTITLDATDFEDSDYTRSGADITINTAGVYRVSYSIYWDTTANARRTVEGWVESNTVEIVPSRSAGYARNNTDDTASCAATFMVSLAASDVVRLRAQSTGSVGTALGIGNRIWICLEYLRA